MAAAPDTNYPLGAAMVLAGGACLSIGGLVLRSMETADGWRILFYRSAALALTLLILLAARHRGRLVRAFRDIGWRGALVALSLGLSFVCYIFAVLLTTVANVSFIISAGPLFAALLGWLVLGERVGRATWLVILGAAAGIGLMFADGLTSGGLLGNVVALGVPLTFAVILVGLRASRRVDMVPAGCLGGVVGAVIAAAMTDGFDISAHDLALCLLLGSVQVGMGFTLITMGTRHVPAAQVALLALTETVLAPLWVWIWVGEVPAPLALGGGGLVLACVVAQGVVGLRRERAHRASAGSIRRGR